MLTSKLYDEIKDLESKISEIDTEIKLKFSDISRFHPFELKGTSSYIGSLRYKSYVDAYATLWGRRESYYVTMRALSRALDRIDLGLRTEAEVMDPVGLQTDGHVTSAVEEKMMTVHDVDGHEVSYDSIGKSGPTSIMSDNYADLKAWFERPVLLSQSSLALNTDISNTYLPWDLYFNNPTVRAKLRNVSYIRAKLTLKIHVSGQDFNYGKLIAAYVPLWKSIDPITLFYNVNPTLYRKSYLQYLTQVRGRQIIDPKDNIPYELDVAYINPMAFLRLFNNSTSALGTAQSYNDIADMGRLYIYTINQLKTVSSTTSTPIGLSIYGVLSQVELGPPTGSVTAITTESQDEREVGPIEKTSSALSKAFGYMADAPVIGIYARASSMALGALSKVASLFGWSYPVMNTAPMRVRMQPFQNGAQVIGYDTGKRISFDPKCELTVDPRYMATSEDELVIKHIANKESLLTTFNWAPTAVPLSTNLWLAPVHPQLIDPTTVTTHKVCQPTAVGFATAPFSYWRGKIKFRFEFVCSKFHRGKVAIIVDPNINQSTLITAALSLNKQFTEVVDLQVTQNKEVCVDWMFPRPFAQTVAPLVANGLITLANGPAFYKDIVNGFITVVPLTYNQSPDSSTIPVNVYISCEDLEVAVPTSLNLPSDRNPYINLVDPDAPMDYKVVDEDEGYIMTESHDEGNPRGATCDLINPTGANMDDVYHHHMGERHVSFRSLLKRFVTIESKSLVPTIAVRQMLMYTGKFFPSPQVPYSTAPGFSNNVNTIYDYLRWAFLGQRGSFRRRINLVGIPSVSNTTMTKVSFTDPSVAAPLATGLAQFSSFIVPTSNTVGTVSFVQATNGGIEFSLPFYSNNLFCWSATNDNWDTTGAPTIDGLGLKNFTVSWNTDIATTNRIDVQDEFATGEDFSFIYWVAAPPYTTT